MASLRKLRRALRERGADIKNLLVDNKYDIQRDSNDNLTITDTETGNTYTFKEDGTFESSTVGTEDAVISQSVEWPDGSTTTTSPSGGGGGISDGEDFDGQETSEFSNLQSLGTDSLSTQSYEWSKHILARGKFTDGFIGTRVYDPTDYSPTGDAVRQALNDLNADSGQTGSAFLRLPPEQNLELQSPLDIDVGRFDGIQIHGAYGVSDVNQTVARFIDNTGDSNGPAIYSSSGNSYVGLKNIGVFAGDPGQNQDGIDFSGQDQSYAVNIGAFGHKRHGVIISGDDSRAIGLQARDVGGNCVRLVGNKMVVHTIEAEASQKAAILVNSDLSTIISPVGQESHVGMRVENTRKTQILGSRFNKNTFRGVSVKSGNSIRLSHLNCDNPNADESFRIGQNGTSRVVLTDSTINGDTTQLDIRSGASKTVLKRNNVGGAGSNNFDSAATDLYIDDPTINGALGASPSSGSLSISFDTAFTSKPHLGLNYEQMAIWGITSWSTNGAGDYTGATLSFEDNAGNAVNPSVHWKAMPRNVGVF